jgi:hypothetical protein
MDIFIHILLGLSVVLIVTGIVILNKRSWEIGALIGFIPLAWGLGIGALGGLLWCIQHLAIHVV